MSSAILEVDAIHSFDYDYLIDVPQSLACPGTHTDEMLHKEVKDGDVLYIAEIVKDKKISNCAAPIRSLRLFEDKIIFVFRKTTEVKTTNYYPMIIIKYQSNEYARKRYEVFIKCISTSKNPLLGPLVLINTEVGTYV